jgi:response regulator RpfG family c-di-GMP phosphodiesterase
VREHGERIALALLDVVLPKPNGRELVDRIAALAPATKVLFTSGYAADGIHRDFILEKDLALLPKPWSREALLGRIRTRLDAAPSVSADRGRAQSSMQILPK